MEINERKLRGVFEITLQPHYDKRGFFMRVFDDNILSQDGIKNTWVQENHSYSKGKNIIRGLHFQRAPYTEAKMVRCIRGAVMDVFVDLRSESDTFGMWDSIELTSENKKMILIPRGFAHGYRTLSEESEVLYKVDNTYKPDHENGIMWNDPEIDIDWGTSNPILSEKDQHNLSMKQFIDQKIIL
jgi:dTDP-4-dehydrorhamnose 3,5-epimerase